jgi:hypothetical protein
MMRSAIVLGAILFCASASLLQAATPAYQFDCDAPSGRAAFWTRELLELPVSVSGTLQLVEKKSHATWASLSTVLITNADRDSSSGFRIGWPRAKKSSPFVELLAPGVGTPVRHPWAASGPVEFLISIAADGTVQVRVGEVSHTAKVDATKPLKLHLSCSTAEVKFDAVRVW